MHDIRTIRENPAAFDAALARRGLPAMAQYLLTIDEERRRKILAVETARADQNVASRAAGAAKARGDEVEFLRLLLLAQAKDALITALPTLADDEVGRLHIATTRANEQRAV